MVIPSSHISHYVKEFELTTLSNLIVMLEMQPPFCDIFNGSTNVTNMWRNHARVKNTDNYLSLGC